MKTEADGDNSFWLINQIEDEEQFSATESSECLNNEEIRSKEINLNRWFKSGNKILNRLYASRYLSCWRFVESYQSSESRFAKKHDF